MKRTLLYVDIEDARISKVLDIISNTLERCDVVQLWDFGEAYKVLLERTIDIFIINIPPSASRLSDLEGLHFVSAIREIPRYVLVPVILFSSLQDPQMYVYEKLNCLGYLSKTFPAAKLEELLQKASHYRTKRPVNKTLVFRKNRSIYPVPVKDIVYMTRENENTKVHLADGEILDILYISYSRLLADADDSNLFMCNRSTIVNLECVYAVDSTNCYGVLRDGRGMLDIGLKYRTEINADFSN